MVTYHIFSDQYLVKLAMQGRSYDNGYFNCRSLYFVDQYLLQYKFLFPREKLTYGAEIGSGWFGKVGNSPVFG